MRRSLNLHHTPCHLCDSVDLNLAQLRLICRKHGTDWLIVLPAASAVLDLLMKRPAITAPEACTLSMRNIHDILHSVDQSRLHRISAADAIKEFHDMAGRQYDEIACTATHLIHVAAATMLLQVGLKAVQRMQRR